MAMQDLGKEGLYVVTSASIADRSDNVTLGGLESFGRVRPSASTAKPNAKPTAIRRVCRVVLLLSFWEAKEGACADIDQS